MTLLRCYSLYHFISVSTWVCFLARSFSDLYSMVGLLVADATVIHVAPATVVEAQIPGQPAVPLL